MDRSIESILGDYEKHEGEIINLLEKEKKYLAKPRKENVCHFCDVFEICNRGENL